MDYQIGSYKHVAGDLVQIDTTPYQIVSKKAFIEMRNIKDGDQVKIGYDPSEEQVNGVTKAFFITSTTGKLKTPLFTAPQPPSTADQLWHTSIIAASINLPKNTDPDALIRFATELYHKANFDPDKENIPLSTYL
ncbi:hypothetical protein [Bacteroides sp.]|uniref:hypothetical protein n=1 Tax=Bacteroides sp. TaxID=29523 RepID=UPI0026367789|nr:hypothetical protein [Bacteroides sp.]MDD3040707.1 hypothetical protein [Bacteroides sp.]